MRFSHKILGCFAAIAMLIAFVLPVNAATTLLPNAKQCFSNALPKRVVSTLFADDLLDSELQQLSDHALQEIRDAAKQWCIKPNSTEGYRTAEVTLGGIDTDALSSQTMEVKSMPGLYFVGEVLDVTGWLGGYNFQWAWSSGWAAGQVV